MPDYYVYFISSLPMLHFGARPPFSYAKFLRMAEGLIKEEDMAFLASLEQLDDEKEIPDENKIGSYYREFDRILRNELVKARASRKHIDPEKYLRRDGFTESAIVHLVQAALRNPSILDAEKLLDLARWGYLEELNFGHYFDTASLVIYAYKLLLLERWERIRLADKPRLLEENLSAN